MKYYGSLFNRLNEGKQFIDEIKVGDGVTEYSYSDRRPYEIIEVKNQKNIVIRVADCNRVDNNGISDCQDYEFTSNPNNPSINLVLRNGSWYSVSEINKESLEISARKEIEDGMIKTFEAAYNYVRWMCNLTEKQILNIENGKTVKKYNKWNVSIGTMDCYHDYSF